MWRDSALQIPFHAAKEKKEAQDEARDVVRVWGVILSFIFFFFLWPWEDDKPLNSGTYWVTWVEVRKEAGDAEKKNAQISLLKETMIP